jgi:hypothetical protein
VAAPKYFLPKVRAEQLFPGERINRDLLRAHGLDDLFRDVGDERALDWANTELIGSHGPGGQPGMMISALPVVSRRAPRTMGYKPDDATWRWFPMDDGKYWLGVDTTDRPRPEDLARRQQQDGHFVELGDGQRWLVPAIRRPEYGDRTVPGDDGTERTEWGLKDGIPLVNRAVRYNPVERQVIRQIRPNEQRVWDWSAQFYQLVYGSAPQMIDLPEQIEYCAYVLGLNYRLTVAEINELELFTEDQIVAIVQATVDLPWFKDYVDARAAKKNGLTNGA